MVILTVLERLMTVSGFKKVTNGHETVTNGHETVENANGTFMQKNRNGESLALGNNSPKFKKCQECILVFFGVKKIHDRDKNHRFFSFHLKFSMNITPNSKRRLEPLDAVLK
jgi:hypothetical protein